MFQSDENSVVRIRPTSLTNQFLFRNYYMDIEKFEKIFQSMVPVQISWDECWRLNLASALVNPRHNEAFLWFLMKEYSDYASEECSVFRSCRVMIQLDEVEL